MGSIRIIAAPPGQAPEKVRQAWIGCVFPAVAQRPKTVQLGALKGQPQNLGGYTVDASTAFQVLREKDADAYAWWEGSTFFEGMVQLVFARDVCEEVAEEASAPC